MGKQKSEGVSIQPIGSDNNCLPSGELRLFDSVDCSAAQAVLDRLLSDVASGCGRVQINGSAPNANCVLISAAELASLEQALEILSGMDGALAMREQLAKIVAASGAQSSIFQTPIVNALVNNSAVPLV